MRYILFLLVLPALFSCHHPESAKYPYSLAEFPDKVQPYLFRIVNAGFIGETNYECISFLDTLLTDKQLLQLTRCEHPLLRSVALSIAIDRPSIDHYAVMMDHLDDTARVNWFFQCASFEFTYVSDYMLMKYEWKTKTARERTVKKVLREHNYLEQAYNVVDEVQGDTTWYGVIKDMAERDIRLEKRSRALYALASYKNPKDDAFLQDILTHERHNLNTTCLALMKDFPSLSYQPILERHLKTLYRRICMDNTEVYEVRPYFHAVASYKTKESASLLKKIFFSRPILPCSPRDTSSYISDLYEAITDNDCPLYKEMTAIARSYLEKEKERIIELPSLSVDSSFTKEPATFRWR